MAIIFHPRAGQILFCDFSKGFKEPEMVKHGRPVIVLRDPPKHTTGLVTIVPLSTARPNPVLDWHYLLPRQCLPQTGFFQRDECWVKGDMLYTVGFHRLDLVQLGKKNHQTGKRLYYTSRLSRDRMRQIYKCILLGINLRGLVDHL